MRRGTTKFQSIIDKQIALKFRKNTSGSYNVYGKGVNSIGIFSLVGTVILLGKGSGQVELYRIYPLAAADPVLPQQTTSAAPPSSGKALARAPLPTRELAAAVAAAEKSISDPMQQGSSLSSITPTRKESSRQRKLPSRLEDDNPQAQIARMMEKCTQILKFMKEKDIATGAFFGEPVDPVAQCIPTYHQVIKNPMDLGTVQTRLDAGEIESPEEFARIVKLIFENAMKFNIDATHVVHLAARDLLILFNQKFRDLERMVEIFRKERKPSKAELKESQRKQKEADRERKRKEKDDRFKRKRENSTSSEGEEKRTKLNEMQVAATATAQTLEKLSDKPSGDVSVSRNEFIMVVDTLKQMQQQMMQMQSMFLSAMNNTEKSDTVKNDTATAMTSSSTRNMENHNSTKRKKPKKKTTSNRESDMKSSDAAPEKEAAPVAPVVSDEEKPLTLKEQEDLTEAINSIHPDKLETIIQIIRESATLNDDEEEIDLEIDQLDTSTQRKLQRFVMKNVKPKRAKKTAKQKQVVPAPAKSTSKKPVDQPGIEITPEKKPDPQIDTKANSASFLDYPDSDSDSDSDSDESSKKQAPQKSNDKKDDAFDTNTLHDEEDDELMNANIAPNWNISKPLKTEDEDKDSGDEDDAWNAARNTSAAQKALDKERQAREEKMRLEAEVAKEKHLAEAAKHAEQLRAKRKEKEAEATRLREEKEQEEEEKRKKAREKQMAEVDSVQQTIDIEHQRDLMKELERDYYDKDLAGASPSSDFGF
uniref:Bromo domain-containing protein n=1 Tax=Eucampia antarctica TaxID=49252 RepID=A0A7S2RYW8_9STRA